MGSTQGPLTVREAVLLVLDAAGGSISGRTAVQKLCYFGAQTLGLDLGHRAHYYGPYSRQVEAAVANETFAGDLEEHAEPFEYGREGRTYHYQITSQGREIVQQLRADHPFEAAALDEMARSLGELVPGYRQKELSIAAKVDLIVHSQNEAVPAAAIPALARGLGWQVDDEDVDRAVGILVRLERVQTN